jgi:hypothetical protein
MAKSTERHQRETMARAASMAGASRENTRKAGTIQRTFIDGRDAIMSGEHSVNALYKLARGDDRVGVHLLVDVWLRDAINSAAKANGMSRQDYLTALLTQIFGE